VDLLARVRCGPAPCGGKLLLHGLPFSSSATWGCGLAGDSAPGSCTALKMVRARAARIVFLGLMRFRPLGQANLDCLADPQLFPYRLCIDAFFRGASFCKYVCPSVIPVYHFTVSPLEVKVPLQRLRQLQDA